MVKLKCILVGYPGSQKIIPASKYLVEKYLPFEFHWLNWVGDLEGWSSFLATYLTHLEDEFIILTLDDYLVAGFDKEIFECAKKRLRDNIVAVKLCETNAMEQEAYPVTTQYTIWRRTALIKLLNWTTSPWNFEMYGSNRFPEMNMESLHGYPAIKYDTHSCLSSRWRGVNLRGVNPEDLETINKLI